jgi:WD40 repeat protein
VSASGDGTLRVWGLDDLKCRKVIEAHKEPVTSLALWSVSDAAPDPGTQVTCFTYKSTNFDTCLLCAGAPRTPDTRTNTRKKKKLQFLLSASLEGRVRLWDAAPGKRFFFCGTCLFS